jgi:hypothetical protein
LNTGLAVLESDADPELPQGWVVIKGKRYGTTLVTVVRPASPPRLG